MLYSTTNSFKRNYNICNCIIRYFFFSDQAEARRSKVKAAKQRREERQAQKRAEILQAYAKEDGATTTPSS